MPHREGSGAHSKVGVHENVVRRSVNLEIGREEIEVLDAGELAVKRFSKRPAVTEPSSPATSLSRRTCGAESAHNAGSAGQNFIRPGRDGSPAQESRRRRALAAQGGVSRPAPVSFPKSAWKNAVSRLRGEEPDAPWASPPYLTATLSRPWGDGCGAQFVAEPVQTTPSVLLRRAARSGHWTPSPQSAWYGNAPESPLFIGAWLPLYVFRTL